MPPRPTATPRARSMPETRRAAARRTGRTLSALPLVLLALLLLDGCQSRPVETVDRALAPATDAVDADEEDVAPVRAVLGRLGVEGDKAELVALLAKAEAATTGAIRGYRHTMLNDSDISSTRHARAFVAGALASVVGHTEIFVSGGAEHQGPDGGGPVAIIASRKEALAA